MGSPLQKDTEPFKITGNWDIQSKHLKQEFSQLIDADLKFETGQEDSLIGRLMSRLNKKEEEIIYILKRVMQQQDDIIVAV